MAKYLITADPVASFQPRFDTTLRLLAELRARAIEVDYCDLLACDPHRPTAEYLADLPVHAVIAADPGRAPYLELGPLRRADAREYTTLVHRKDPPVDALYRAHAAHFASLPPHPSVTAHPAPDAAGPLPAPLQGPLQINAPAEVLHHSEHLLAAEFPAFAVPTTHCTDLPALVAAVRAQPQEAVLKPLAECSGRGIEFFAPTAPVAELSAYWAAQASNDGVLAGVVVQPYQPAITTRGDLRILVMNRRILGSVARIPRPDSRLANLHQGASVRAFTPTPRQLAAVAAVADALTPRGLYLLGLDFIGDLLSEINFTSPSALVQINEVMQRRAEVDLVDEIERLAGVHGPAVVA